MSFGPFTPPEPPSDFVRFVDTDGHPQILRKSDIMHLRETRNFKTQVSHRWGYAYTTEPVDEFAARLGWRLD